MPQVSKRGPLRRAAGGGLNQPEMINCRRVSEQSIHVITFLLRSEHRRHHEIMEIGGE